MKKEKLLFPLCLLLFSCANNSDVKNHEVINVDTLITSGLVYSGENLPAKILDVGICGDKICYVGMPNDSIKAKSTIDADGLIVTPGFIDPHTHSLQELQSADNNSNLNYLTQGVTTVIIGNDGEGTPFISELGNKLSNNKIGTNVGLLVGHGNVRQQVMGLSDNAPTETQLEKMKILVAKAMEEGALGFSTGLYYVPGRFSKTPEVIALAKIAANFGGLYESHIRDESTFNIGFLNSIKEVVEIAKKANINAHIAHIKALGVDVWGQSKQAVALINQARREGVVITADQYPWQASGTFLHSAVIPSWVMADSEQAFFDRLTDAQLLPKIKSEIKENIRRRGGATALLVTVTKNNHWRGKTLAEIAIQEKMTEVDAVIFMNLKEKTRVASFNMAKEDIESFMKQPWVVSSSDGTNGHPRKYASFPRKFQQYVIKKKLMSTQDFIHKSSGKTADIFSIHNRGYIKTDYFADINLIKISHFKAEADFSVWNKLSTGVEYQFVNGVQVVEKGRYTNRLAGKVLLKD